MKNYFLVLLIASVLGGVFTVLASGSNFDKYVKYIASLICVVIIIAPLKSFISAPFEIPEAYESNIQTETSSSEVDEVIASETITELDVYIKDIIFSEFGINTPSTNIKIDWKEDCIIITGVTVFLEKRDKAFREKVEKYLAETVGKGVSVEILDRAA